MAILGVSLTSTLVVYGLFSNSNQVQQGKQEISKTSPLKTGKETQEGKKVEEDKKIEENTDDEKNQVDPGDSPSGDDDEYDFEDLMQKDEKVEILGNKRKRLNDKRKKRKIKTKFSNKDANVLNGDKENANSENISTSKSLNSSKNEIEENEINKPIKQEETEKTKQLRTVFKQIKNYLPEYNLVSSDISDSYFTKRDFLISNTKQFLEHGGNACLDGDLRCDELLAQIKELSKEMSMYCEMCEHQKTLDEISSSIDQYTKKFKDPYNKFLPAKASQFYETVCSVKNDYYMSKMFSQVKNNILKSDIISPEDAGSCSNLENKNSKLIKDFQKYMKGLKKQYPNCKKQLDRQLKKLQADPNQGAPRPAMKDFIPQPKVITIKKVPEN